MDCKIWLFLGVAGLFRFRETVKFDLAFALPPCLVCALGKAGLFCGFFEGEREFFLLKSFSLDEKELADSGGNQKVPFFPTDL